MFICVFIETLIERRNIKAGKRIYEKYILNKNILKGICVALKILYRFTFISKATYFPLKGFSTMHQ
jgi:uncharacterized membrane protein